MRTDSGKTGEINFAKNKNRRGCRGHGQGSLAVIGIGPGDLALLSPKARQAIRTSDVIVGYKTYIALLGGLLKDKEVIKTGMTQEAERARLAIRLAVEGKAVSLVSSGDPGVYGMAGLVIELLSKEESDSIKIEIIPGIIAATSCASLLGAPLTHDFAVISLSDLLTDLKLIERRVILAARGDFVIVLYNPRSKKRLRPLQIAWKLLLKYKSPDTPVGIVRNAARKNQEVTITTLKNMLNKNIDMVTTIIIGNSKTYTKGQFMVTPRGYRWNGVKK